jgi:cell division protein FtsZ
MTTNPRITVIGVGGAGGNAVNNMIRANLEGVEFLVCNTDAQALGHSVAERKIQLGLNSTRGLGAGSKPDVGRVAAEEALDEVVGFIEGSNMVFITAGMGGGTGTGAAPVIARAAREHGILTVGVVTKPFQFEAAHRMKTAEAGIKELQQHVDTLIVIPNQNLFRIANERTTFADAFKMADEVLHSGVRGVTDLIVMPGLINLDFADIRTVMSEMGKAMMGTGEGSGEGRATHAAEAAISNPLLDEVSLKGARAMLINITAGPDLALFEVDEVVNRVRAEVDVDANVIFGSTFEPSMEGKVRVSVVATGMDAPTMHAQRPPVLEVIRGGSDTGPVPPQPAPRPPVAMEDFAIPPSALEPAKPEHAAEPVAAAPEPAPAPVAPPPAQSPGLAVNTGFQVRPGGFVTPEPKRTFSLFERLTGAARRESNEDS